MDNSMRMMAETAAQLLLLAYRNTHPEWTDDKTPIDAIVTWLNLHVETFHSADYPEGTYGFIDPDEDENLIWLLREMQEALRRFTLAHELGHAILHCHGGTRFLELSHRFSPTTSLSPLNYLTLPELSRNDTCQHTDIQENMARLLDQEQFQETLGIGHTYDPRSQRELAANLFAAELLIPFERLHTLYLVQRVPPTSLATMFGVSNAAMLNRLAELLKSSSSRPPTQPVTLTTPETPPVKPPTPAKKQYDAYQQTAIEAPTPALIVAGPGSGKTSTLIGRTTYLINNLAVPAQQILALTFSRKAALEMEERLQQVLDDATLAFPRVSTFHAFCADLLRQYGTYVGLRRDFSLIDDAEGYFLLRQVANEMQLRHYQKLQSPAFYFPDILKAISRAKDELITPDAYAQLAQHMKTQATDDETLENAEKALEVAHVYALYQQELQRRGDSDFGGLLMLTIQLFHEQPALLYAQQQKFLHILVDEFQDVNRASGVLLRELAGKQQNVWVVGDSNQAIYGFRGASSTNISQFEQDFPGALILPLSRNYRSRPDLVTLAESFRCVQLELGQEPGKNQPVRLAHSDTYVTLAKANNETSELTGIVQDIRYKLTQGYTYNDMIVLCRTRAQAQKITRTLAAADLPVVEQGGMLEQDHVKDVISILLLLINKSGMGLLRAARQPAHPLSQNDIEALLLSARTPDSHLHQLIHSGEAPLTMTIAGRHSLTRISQILQSLEHTSDVWSLLAQYLLIETSLIRDLLTTVNKQSQLVLADYDRLLQLARHYDQQQPARARNPASPSPEQPTLAPEQHIEGFLEYLNLLVMLRQDGGSRQSSEEHEGEQANIIRVMTVHASKGLEFPVVYMPALVQRRFPLQARTRAVNPPTGMLQPENEGSTAHANGESSLFYVGVTRARDQLVLSYSEKYGKLKYKRSPYLDAMENGLREDRITRLQWDFQTHQDTQTPETPDAATLPTLSQPNEGFINAMRSPTLSAQAIEAYQRCPREYAYSSIYHFSAGDNTYRLFWQATQKTVEELRQQLHHTTTAEQLHQRIPTQEEVQELYSQHWQSLGGPSAFFAPMYEQHGHEVVEGIRRKLTSQNDITWHVRPDFKVEIAGKKIHVTVDRVEESNTTNVPIKFVRTSFGKRKEKPDAATRELFYTLAYRQQHPGQNVELHSHNMSTGEVIPISLTPKKEQSLYDDVEQAIKGLENNHYPIKPDPFRCPTCSFFFICPS